MQLNDQDLPYFLSFVLLDEASREPSGRRHQTQPLKGFWSSRSGATNLRGTDLPLRRRVCIDAIRQVDGKAISKCAAEIGAILGANTADDVEMIRIKYYEDRNKSNEYEAFFSKFLFWRKWAIESDTRTIQFVLELYETDYDADRRQLLADLIGRLRSDPTQHARNRAWQLEAGQPQLDRIASGIWKDQWQPLATDYWTLGRLHARIGDASEAKNLLGQALKIWREQGEALREQGEAHHDEQSWAISLLEGEISELSGTTQSTRTSDV